MKVNRLRLTKKVEMLRAAASRLLMLPRIAASPIKKEVDDFLGLLSQSPLEAWESAISNLNPQSENVRNLVDELGRLVKAVSAKEIGQPWHHIYIALTHKDGSEAWANNPNSFFYPRGKPVFACEEEAQDYVNSHPGFFYVEYGVGQDDVRIAGGRIELKDKLQNAPIKRSELDSIVIRESGVDVRYKVTNCGVVKDPSTAVA